MALHDASDKRLVLFQGSAHLRREGGVLARLGDARELVETAADAGEFTKQGPRGCMGLGPRPGTERGLADEARRGEACAAGAFRDLAEFVGIEANELGGGPAVGHGPLGISGKRYDATPPIDEYFPVAAACSRPPATSHPIFLKYFATR